MAFPNVFIDDVGQVIHGEEVMADLQDIRDQISALPAPNPNGPPTITVLVDGEDNEAASLLVDAGNGIVWSMRWREDSPSIHKWEVLDPTPLFSAVNPIGGEVLPAVFAAQDLATVGPELIAPADGDYELLLGAYASATLTELVMLLNGVAFQTPIMGLAPLEMHLLLDDLSAGDVIKMQYANASGAPVTIRDRWMALRPLRVSA